MKFFIDFWKYQGTLSCIFLILMLAFAVWALSTMQIGLMIPAMIFGVFGLFTTGVK